MALTRRGGRAPNRTDRFLDEGAQAAGADLGSATVESVHAAPDAEQAALGLLKIAEALRDRGRPLAEFLEADPQLGPRLALLAGTSEAAVDHLLRWPESIERLMAAHAGGTSPMLVIGSESLRADNLCTELRDAVTDSHGAVCTGAAAVESLRRRYRDWVIALMVDDISHEDPLAIVEQVTGALSDLACAAIEAAALVARSELEADPEFRFTVVAMGKCGARELNYVSDVDVMYVFEPRSDESLEADRQLAAGIANRVREILSDPGPEPALWELDAALRPEGKAGPLARTLEEFDSYYRKVAHNWECQALLKARWAAGDAELGTRFEQMAAGFAFAAPQREGFIPEVRAMRRRVVDLIPAKEQERQLKLGPGGLRDVEFTCQLLQLVHGCHDADIQVRSTFAALDALGGHGYIGREQAQVLRHSYAFMRVIEHRLQMPRLSRQALIPDREDRLRTLARSVYSDGERTAQRLSVERTRCAREVRALHEQIFYRPVLEAAVGDSQVVTLSEEAARDRLAAFGYRDTKAAMGHIHSLSSGVTRAAYIQRQVLPALLDWFSEGVDPDAGLLAFRRLSEELADSSWFLKMLRDSGVAARRAARVLSLSRFASDLLLENPEAVAWLGVGDQLADPGTERMSSQMREVAVRHGDEAVGSIRGVYMREVLRIALADVLGLDGPREVMRRLTAVTDLAVDAALLTVRKRLDASFGIDAYEFAVVAMGRLGGGEIGYFSDADVMFVYRPGMSLSAAARESLPGHVRQVALALTRELAAPLSHLPIVLDADLRPEGKAGPLVRSLESYETYYSAWSEPWEAQALLRARVIAGDSALAQDYRRLIDPLRYPPTVGPESIVQIRRLKARMESERLPRGAEPKRHLKLGTGGLSDVEWCAQLLQLEHACCVSSYRTTGTVQALEAAVEAGDLSREDADELINAWLRASRIRSAMMLYRGRSSDSLPVKETEIEAVAQLLGYADDEQQLVDDYLGGARRARRVMERVFYGFSSES